MVILMAKSFDSIEKEIWASDGCKISTRTIALSAILCVCWFYPQLAAGQTTSIAQAQTVNPGDAIVVPECRIHIVNELSLSSERSGILDFVTPQGTFVKQGQVIAQLRDAIARASYSIAEREASNDIEIRFAKKAGELAQLKYERAQKADQELSGTVTEFELRELRLAAERSLLQLQQAEHQFAISYLKKQEQLGLLKSFQITAPFDALIRVAHEKPGEYVREGDVVLEIVNDEMIRVDGYVNLDDLPLIATGSRVLVSLPQTGREPVTFRGQISFVDTKIEPISMKARVSAEVQNSNSILKDGLLVTMAIATTANPKSYK